MLRFRVELLLALAACSALTAAPCLSREGLLVEELARVEASVSKLGTDGLRVSFEAKDRDYRLRLVPNPRLVRWATGSRWQHYSGVLERVPGSWARLSVAGNSLSGVIFDGQQLLVLEPGEGTAAMVFRLVDLRFEPQVSFKGDAVAMPSGMNSAAGQPGFVRLEGLSAARKLEISAIGDATFRARYASDELARDGLLSRLNIVDGIFSAQVGAAIEVTSVNMADSLSESLDASTDPPILLDSLGRLRQQTSTLNSRGLTHLFTGRNLDGNSVGIGYTASLCNQRYSASLAQAHDSAAVDGLISAHEIGHVFGAPHDGEGQCAATSPTQFIMAPTLNSQATTFSQCSLEQMAPRVASASCLEPLLPPDLALPASLGSHDVAVGADFNWRIDLANQGESAATNARVTVQVTPAITIVSAIVSATAGGETCVVQASLATCDVATVNAGESLQMTFVMRSPTAGTFAAHAQVVAADDANRANDAGDGTLLVQAGQSPPPPAAPPPPAGRSGGGGLDGVLLGILGVLLGAAARRRANCGDPSSRRARRTDVQLRRETQEPAQRPRGLGESLALG
jgi:hypothetical protein